MTASFKFSFIFLILFAANTVVMAEQSESVTEEEKPVDTASSISVPPLPIALDKQHQEDIKHYLPADKVKPILVGTQEYITLIHENTSPNNKGVAILLPDWHQGAVSPKAINFLRKALPKDGWTTITIQPDAKPTNFPSTALKVSVQREENNAILANYKSNFIAMLNAVSIKAQQYPGIVMMIAQGNHGAMLIELINADESLQAPNAIILLSSYAFTGSKLLDESNTQFANALANSEPPVLDLYLKHDNAIVKAKAEQRTNIAKQEMKVYYRQRQLNNTVMGFYPEQALLIQINSWLKSIGW